MLFFESASSQRAWEVRGGRDPDQTEQAEFQLGAERASVAIYVCSGPRSIPGRGWVALGFPISMHSAVGTFF